MDEPIKTEVKEEKPATVSAAASKNISYDDFKKVEMRVGRVVSGEIVEGADKLYKFEVDLDEEKPRQILSAIREFYPDINTIIGKKLVRIKSRTPYD